LIAKVKRLTLFKNNHELAAESAVVGYPHPIKGEGVYAYVVLKEAGSSLSEEEKDKLAQELRALVKTKISGFAVPEKLQVKKGFMAF
jgi:acetyl-CoA synthetase